MGTTDKPTTDKLCRRRPSWLLITILLITTIIITLIYTTPHSPSSPTSTASNNLQLLLTALLSSDRSYATSNSTLEAEQLAAIVHYATSTIVPQQTEQEISITFKVLRDRSSPANFLVYGLGHDSQMWAGINPGGTTLFLEEDEIWYKQVKGQAPYLNAHAVKYRTMLKEAGKLINEYKNEPDCQPSKAFLRGNNRCRLALNELPDEVYEKEWDLIMIDAPKGYFPEAPGRMSAIFSAAVMARNRKSKGPTHVFLHDVNRPVEKQYAEEFLCKKNLVDAVGRLWHFAIPAAMPGQDDTSFC